MDDYDQEATEEKNVKKPVKIVSRGRIAVSPQARPTRIPVKIVKKNQFLAKSPVKPQKAASDATVTEEEDSDSYLDEPGARTEMIVRRSDSDGASEEGYFGGYRNDFHT